MKKRTKWVPKVVTKWMSFEEAKKRCEAKKSRIEKKEAHCSEKGEQRESQTKEAEC